MATCRACGAALGLRARLPAALRPPVLQHRRRLSGGEEGRPRTPLAQAAWDYQQEAKARLAEDGGINTETAFEILANHRIRQAMVNPPSPPLFRPSALASPPPRSPSLTPFARLRANSTTFQGKASRWSGTACQPPTLR